MRIIHWNISWAGEIETKVKFINKYIIEDTVICLQEIQQSQYDYIIKTLSPKNYSYSLDLRPPGKNEGKNRKLGVCILSNFGNVSKKGLVERSIFPDRTLYNCINGINILSFHSITGCDYKKSKSSNFASIADFLEENDFDFFTTDSNEPKEDNLNEEKIVFHENGYNAYLLLGAQKVHNLNDSLREWYIINNKKSKKNPLELSYKTKTEEKRYDFIYFNKNKWAIANIKYEYKGAIKAGSDHAIIIGDYKKI